MNLSFKAPGLNKNWSVSDNSLTIGNTEYPFSEISSFKLVTSASAILPGVAQGFHNGKLIQCAFKFADRKSLFNQICLRLWRLQPVCWTIKNIDDHNTAKKEGYISIFEQFEP